MTNFNTPSQITIPDSHSVDIWQVHLDSQPADTSALLSILDAHELDRHKKMHKRVQLAYLLSHTACREILAQYLKLPPAQVRYKKNQHGKPFLDLDTSLNFNMSQDRKSVV